MVFIFLDHMSHGILAKTYEFKIYNLTILWGIQNSRNSDLQGEKNLKSILLQKR